MNEGTLIAVFGAGLVGGLGLLVRGLAGYRDAGRVSGTSTSRIGSLALGEVVVSGVAEPIELTLVSPIQSRPCVYYRASITEPGDEEGRVLLREERAIGFRVREATGAIRVFPAGARWDVPERFDESSSAFSGEPTGVALRTGSVFAPGPEDREAQIAALLTVRRPGSDRADAGSSTESPFLGFGRASAGLLGGRASERSRRYREARIDVGETVTVLGRALPFGDLADPTAANLLAGSAVDAADPEVALDLAEARAAGALAATPAEAWGNAAIPGFGIGRPVRPPILDAAATPLPPGEPELAARVAATWDIAPDTLVLAASDEVPLEIAVGAPTAVTDRHETRFVVGLVGAALAIGSAMGVALVLDGGLR